MASLNPLRVTSMKPRTRSKALVVLCAVAWTTPVALVAATHDNNVEWNGVTHIDWQDRAPRCPINGESFTVSFQTWHFDLTAARVYVNAGSPIWVDAQFALQRGPYDVWTATIPATSPTTSLQYYFELTDGTDTDYLGPGGMSDNPPASGWVVDFATLLHAPLGATLTSDGGAVFKVWDPNATTASVAGQFNGWSMTSLPMTKSGAYSTRKVAPPVTNYQKYKYVFNYDPNGSTWKTDARGRAMDQGDNGNTIIINPAAYTWHDAAFTTPPFEEMVIYELHVGTFSGRNDGLNRMGKFRDIVNHLLYLGVNTVELMPVTEFDYYESWGYNPIDNWAPENAYGSPDDYKYTIDKLHQNGIGVVMDVCFNHFSSGGNYLWYYDPTQIYFDNPPVDTPWGSQAAFWRSEVRDYYADAVLNWLDEYRVDGFRMDATRYMRNNNIFEGGYPDGWGLMQRINNNIDARKVQAVSIAEELPNTPAITTSTGASGAGFDAQWHMLFRDNVRGAIFAAASGDPSMAAVRDAITDASYFSKTQLVRYVESHDEAGNGSRLGPAIDSTDSYSVWAKGRSKLAQGLTILTPGIPMFLMGGEWMEDTQLGSGVNNRIDWSKAVGRAPIVQFFRDVINIRRSNCGFRSDASFGVYQVDDTNNVIAFWKGSGAELVVVANFSNNNYTGYNLPFPHGGTWYEILNSQALDYLGNGWGNGGSVYAGGTGPYIASVTIPQMGLLVFRLEDPSGRSADLDYDGNVDLRDFAVFQQSFAQRGCGLAADLRENGRVDGDDFAEFGLQMGGPGN